MGIESPCRLSVFVARDAPIGVVLRRGPSNWARLTLWHTETDEFEPGQWLSGRVFERRSDISPDGRLFAYFVRKETAKAMREVGADSWIAVSRPPWFTALALWAIGGTYCTGPCFPESGKIFLGGIEGAPDKGVLPRWLKPAKTPQFVDHTPDWTDRTVYFSRLLRDGWTPIPDTQAAFPWWEHASPDARSTLVMMPRSDGDFTSYGGRHVTEYAVRDETTGAVHDLGRATWADWDHRGRLMIARDGALLHWQSPESTIEIANFNGERPKPEMSPARASEWPPAP
jgi:hypothetical protein